VERVACGRRLLSKDDECDRGETGVWMKLITRKGAPSIPLELIEAQESGDLVFFCGAGISSLAGLPDYANLVRRVYADLGETETEMEREARKVRLFDRVLGLLEKRMIGNIVRQSIIKQLTISDSADFRAHRALLQLSETKHGKYRLVTTNVDHGFLRSGLLTRESIDAHASCSQAA
jgi:NAD-dependent SIR2 family protein deacetylase